jgi:hypothetical protein
MYIIYNHGKKNIIYKRMFTKCFTSTRLTIRFAILRNHRNPNASRPTRVRRNLSKKQFNVCPKYTVPLNFKIPSENFSTYMHFILEQSIPLHTLLEVNIKSFTQNYQVSKLSYYYHYCYRVVSHRAPHTL